MKLFPTKLHKTILITLTLLSLGSNTVNAAVEDGVYIPPQYKDLRTNDRISSLDCATAALYHEARGESDLAAMMVMSVILNRVNDDRRFPNDICGVVFAKNAFSFIGDGKSDEMKNVAQYERLYKLVVYVIENKDVVLRFTGDLDHYHEVKISPWWSRVDGFHKVTRVDNHVFYSSEW